MSRTWSSMSRPLSSSTVLDVEDGVLYIEDLEDEIEDLDLVLEVGTSSSNSS